MPEVPPLLFRWSGEAFEPVNRTFAAICDKHFVVPEVYRLEVHEERSGLSHRHFFASINEAWKNLPDELALEYPTPDRLRKKSLIKAGYADETSIVCDSVAAARKVAAFIEGFDSDAVVLVRGNVVKRFTAQSQSARSMNKERFQASKTAVLNIVSSLIGVTPETLAANAPEATQKAQERVAEPDPKPPSPEPESTPTEAPSPPAARLPRNGSEYTIWFQGWLSDLDATEAINDRWNAERKLRNACGVTADDREPLERMKAARIKELKG